MNRNPETETDGTPNPIVEQINKFRGTNPAKSETFTITLTIDPADSDPDGFVDELTADLSDLGYTLDYGTIRITESAKHFIPPDYTLEHRNTDYHYNIKFRETKS